MLPKLKKFWKSLGPGFVTGAANDDPSGIITYMIAGAKFGLSTIWLALFSLPLMIAVQEMSGRIGRITNMGLAGNMKRFYPRWLLVFIAVLIVTANTVNIGADVASMAQATAIILPIVPEKVAAIIMTLVILILTIILPYDKIFTTFKWLALSLLAYIFATFTVQQDWLEIMRNLLIPTIIFSKDFLIIMVAFFGTTISPYMFFWQANQEVEGKMIEQCKPGRVCHLKPTKEGELRRLRLDTRVGMSFSNLITFFIIALTASTLFKAGIHNIETLKDAAEALRPLAGDYAFVLFTAGILGSGFLAIPVLAGSAAYVIAEVFGWSKGLNKTFTKAKEFYAVIIASTVIGLLIPLLGFNPIKALFYTALFYGVISPIIIYIILHMANNEKIVGHHKNSRSLNFWGYIAFIVMTFSAAAVFFIL